MYETSLSEVVLDWHAEDAPGPVACLEVYVLVEPRVLHAQIDPTGSEPPCAYLHMYTQPPHAVMQKLWCIAHSTIARII